MDKEGFIVAIICCTLIIGAYIGSFLKKGDFERRAVEANVAYYDNKTKEFKFIDVKSTK